MSSVNKHYWCSFLCLMAVFFWKKAANMRNFISQFHNEIQKTIKTEINSMIRKGELPDTALSLIADRPKCSNFYVLPKIHKQGNPGRPVVSSCSCPTNLISKYLSQTLKPIVRALPSFVKDTNHALNLVKDFRFKGQKKLLFTMDIKGLYTNIPNEYGLNAMKYFLDKRDVQNHPTHTLVRLAELVLTQNCFRFGDDPIWPRVFLLSCWKEGNRGI